MWLSARSSWPGVSPMKPPSCASTLQHLPSIREPSDKSSGLWLNISLNVSCSSEKWSTSQLGLWSIRPRMLFTQSGGLQKTLGTFTLQSLEHPQRNSLVSCHEIVAFEWKHLEKSCSSVCYLKRGLCRNADTHSRLVENQNTQESFDWWRTRPLITAA